MLLTKRIPARKLSSKPADLLGYFPFIDRYVVFVCVKLYELSCVDFWARKKCLRLIRILHEMTTCKKVMKHSIPPICQKMRRMERKWYAFLAT